MPRSFKLPFAADTKTTVRAILGVLLLANVGMAFLILFPPGGSADQLEQQLISLESRIRTDQARLNRTRALVQRIEKGREEGDQFLDQYFLGQRVAYSAILAELNTTAKQARIKPKEAAFQLEPVEGSDRLSMMTITANFEGTYADLMTFVRFLDKSERFMIIETLQAAPQQNSQVLDVRMKLDTFVRDDSSALLPVGDPR